MAVIHITEAEAKGIVYDMFRRVRAGVEFHIERDSKDIVVMRPPRMNELAADGSENTIAVIHALRSGEMKTTWL